MSKPGQFFWYELMSTDVAASAAFYGAVLGWGTQDTGMDYTMFTVAGEGMAGMMKLPDTARAMGARPSWIGYILAPQVDTAVDTLVAKGGHVWRPAADIPGVGRFAVVADPQGATIALMAPTGPARETTPPQGTPGYVGWHELMAADLQPALDFYIGMFGWNKIGEHDMGPMGPYLLFSTGEGQAGGMMAKSPEFPTAMWVYYFNVDSIGQAVDRVTAGGGTVVTPPMQVPGGTWVAVAIDPQGALFALVSPTP